MDSYRQLAQHLSGLKARKASLYQGFVKSVEGKTCTVQIDGLDVPDVRLRASTTDEDSELILVPAVGSAVIVGALSDDFGQLALLSMDKVDTITIHGGKQGGLVLAPSLVKKLNALEEDLNNLKQAIKSAPTVPNDGGSSFKASLQGWAGAALTKTKQSDIENSKVKQ
nr:MAG TPA: hypothetical protein [Caudoviricetes sp.]